MRRCLLAVVAMAACYAPSPPPGAPCSTFGTCPSGLQCIAMVCVAPGTLERDASQLGDAPLDTEPVDDARLPDAVMVDARLDAMMLLDAAALPDAASPDAASPDASTAPTRVLLGTSVTALLGSTTTLTLGQPVPAGSLVIVQVAARGNTPIGVTDSKANAWTMAVAVENSTSQAVAAIFYGHVATALVAGDTITASVGGFAQPNDRAIGALIAGGVSALDQIGTAQATTVTPSVATLGAVTAASELFIGVTATGFITPDTFTPSSGFTQIYEYGTSNSSGSFDDKITTTAAGVATYGTTTTQGGMANYAVVIATFK